ncbi:unnamed protein product, partial [marine sediment metagenome]
MSNLVPNSINSSTHFGPSVTKTSTASGSQKFAPAFSVSSICNLADYIGSTRGIIEFANNNPAKEYIIGTELG